MLSNEFFTWNRVLNIAVLDGRLPADELRDRTLSFVFTDQSKEFDHIEWRLNNSDGLLTRPEYVGVGLFVSMQLGYPDGPTAHRVFVINRMTGGVGVWGRERPSVGSSEAEITFYGRNRNAPGGRTGHRTLPRTAVAPRSGGRSASGGYNRYTAKGRSLGGRSRKGSSGPKTYGPTMADGTTREMILDQKQPERWIPAVSSSGAPPCTADVVRAILTRHGFVGDYAQVQDTPDTCPGAHIPQGESDGEFLQREAARFGFEVCKLDGDTFHFHKLHWSGSKSIFADVLDYGSSPDILNITIDCDFQLPIPSSVKAKGYNPRTRWVSSGDISYDTANSKSSMSLFAINSFRTDPGRSAAITREDVIPALVESKAAADAKAEQWFTKRHMRAFQLSVECVGNPKLLATRLVQIKGTGSPFVDGIWLIGTARHTISGNDYKTSLRLTHPKKRDVPHGQDIWFSSGDLNYDRANSKSSMGMGQISGYRPNWGQESTNIRPRKK